MIGRYLFSVVWQSGCLFSPVYLYLPSTSRVLTPHNQNLFLLFVFISILKFCISLSLFQFGKRIEVPQNNLLNRENVYRSVFLFSGLAFYHFLVTVLLVCSAV